MIAKYLKTYTIFNGLYKNRNKKMYSRKLKKEVIGNRLHTEFFKEYWKTLTIKMDMWDLQIEINNYFPNPLKNPNVSFLISQMREAVIILKNEQNEYGQYIRDKTIRFLEWFDSEYPQPIKENIPKQKKPQLTFESLFINKENAQKVKDILEQNHYTNGGKWAANKNLYLHHTGNKSELLAAFYTLKKKGILKQGDDTPQATIFYKEFGLKVGEYISDRSLRTEPPPHRQEIFEKLFYSIK